MSVGRGKIFTPRDDARLKELVSKLGENKWDEVSEQIHKFSPRQCKERYTVYLKGNYRNDPWTPEEDKLLIELHKKLGSKWFVICNYFEGRHSNSVKNRWHRYLRKTVESEEAQQAAAENAKKEETENQENEAEIEIPLKNVINENKKKQEILLKKEQSEPVVPLKKEPVTHKPLPSLLEDPRFKMVNQGDLFDPQTLPILDFLKQQNPKP